MLVVFYLLMSFLPPIFYFLLNWEILNDPIFASTIALFLLFLLKTTFRGYTRVCNIHFWLICIYVQIIWRHFKCSESTLNTLCSSLLPPILCAAVVRYFTLKHSTYTQCIAICYILYIFFIYFKKKKWALYLLLFIPIPILFPSLCRPQFLSDVLLL